MENKEEIEGYEKLKGYILVQTSIGYVVGVIKMNYSQIKIYKCVFLKYKLEDMKNAYLYEDKMHEFVKWLSIYDSVCSATCTDTRGAPLPTTTDHNIPQVATDPT